MLESQPPFDGIRHVDADQDEIPNGENKECELYEEIDGQRADDRVGVGARQLADSKHTHGLERKIGRVDVIVGVLVVVVFAFNVFVEFMITRVKYMLDEKVNVRDELATTERVDVNAEKLID